MTVVRRTTVLLALAALTLAAACAPAKKGPPGSNLFYFVIEDEPEGNNIRVSSAPQNVPACTTGVTQPRALQVRNPDGSITLHLGADPSQTCGVLVGIGAPAGTIGALTGAALVTRAGSAPTGLALATDANGDGVYGGTLGGSGFRGDKLCSTDAATISDATELDCRDDAGVIDTTLAQLKAGIPGAGANTPVAVVAAMDGFDTGGAAVTAIVDSLTVNGVEQL